MTEWANYDAYGKRVPSDSERAVFRAKEVSVDTKRKGKDAVTWTPAGG
jgi:hypothetical protein